MKSLAFAALLAAGMSTIAGLAYAEVWTNAEVRAIDTEEATITLKHEPITEMDMPSMTMVFRAVDPSKLEGIEEGDNVQFVAGNENGQMVVVDIKKE